MNTPDTDVIRHSLTLSLIPQMGVATLNKLCEHHQISTTCLLQSSPSQLQLLKLNDKQIHAIQQPNHGLIEQVMAWQHQPDHHIVSYFDQQPSRLYPQLLKHIASPPLLLFVKGDISLLSAPQLAMVGSRNLTISGQDNALFFAHRLAQLGIVITSGLAIGVDGYSHRGAIDGQGKTLAVLGSGLNQIYPKRHLKLAEEIVANGALISEFFPDQGPRAENFPRRNRIISGLSLGTLLIEAAIKSGSLITARYAMDQGKEVFAVPGSIHSPMSKGCHLLIKEGAKLVEDIGDIISEVPAFVSLIQQSAQRSTQPSTQPSTSNLPPVGLLQYIGDEYTSVDIIAERSYLPIQTIMSELTLLELQGYVTQMSGSYMRRLKPNG